MQQINQQQKDTPLKKMEQQSNPSADSKVKTSRGSRLRRRRRRLGDDVFPPSFAPIRSLPNDDHRIATHIYALSFSMIPIHFLSSHVRQPVRRRRRQTRKRTAIIHVRKNVCGDPAARPVPLPFFPTSRAPHDVARRSLSFLLLL